MGLALCKKVVEELGGSITCRSDHNKDVGEEASYTEFILKFPKKVLKQN